MMYLEVAALGDVPLLLLLHLARVQGHEWSSGVLETSRDSRSVCVAPSPYSIEVEGIRWVTNHRLIRILVLKPSPDRMGPTLSV